MDPKAPQYVNGNSASNDQWAAESLRSQQWADIARESALKGYKRARMRAYLQAFLVLALLVAMVGFFVWKIVL